MKRWASFYNRSYFLYLIVLAIVCLTVNHQRLIFRTMDYLQFAPDTIVQFAQYQDSKINRWRLKLIKRYYENVLLLMPDAYEAYATVGFCHYYLKDYDNALKFYLKAIALNGELFGLNYNLGVVNMKKGRYEVAAKYFQTAIAVAPKDAADQYFFSISPFMKDGGANQKIRTVVELGYFETAKIFHLALKGEEGTLTDLERKIPVGLFFYLPIITEEQAKIIKSNPF